MIQDAKRYLERKLKKIDYVHTKLPDNYEDVDARYRKSRDTISVLQGVVKALASYEHGGALMKNFNSMSNTLSETANIKSLKRDDIYTDVSFVGMTLANTVNDNHLKQVCTDFSLAYEEIASVKREMNEQLSDVIEELGVLKKKCKQIDHQRKTVRNTRYDLEELLQENIYKEEEKDQLETRLKTTAETTKTQMVDFMNLSMINGIVIKVAKIHRNFNIKAGAALSKFE